MGRKISYGELRRLLKDHTIPDKDLREYLVPVRGESRLLAPRIVPNPDSVELDPDDPEYESAMDFGNLWCRSRRRWRFKARERAGSVAPIVVSEGDSWFQFPFFIDDVIDHLNKDYLVWSLGAAGDTAENMVRSGEYYRALDDHADRVQAFLFSAAGNDVIGEDPETQQPALLRLLNQQTGNEDAEDLLNEAEVSKTLETLRDYYQQVIARVRADARFQNLPILIHGYDYPIPGAPNDPRDPIYADPDQWLGAPLRSKGITGAKKQRNVVKLLIDRLYDMMGEIAGDPLETGVHVVNVRGTLKDRGDWADEIHGTDEGFERVAELFDEKLRSVLADAERFESGGGVRWNRQIPRLPEFARKPVVDKRVPSIRGIADWGKFDAKWRQDREVFAVGSKFERDIGEDNSLPFFFLEKGAALGHAVCKIGYDGEDGSWSGTGFLVGPGIILTNNHVLSRAENARNAHAEFGYQRRIEGGYADATFSQFDPDKLFISSPAEGGLDYTFVALDDASADAQREWIPMERRSFTISVDERANIIHHPAGLPKRVSLQDNRVLDFHEVMLHYASDTKGGSSGSPVFDNFWQLIALHHAWADLPAGVKSPDPSGGRYINEGVKLSAIAVDLETRLADPADSAGAAAVLALMGGADSITGYFGGLGRQSKARGAYERVVDVYQGGAGDVDIAFWNVEWFNRHYVARVEEVARVVADLNLDIWAFSETSPRATAALVEHLKSFGLEFEWAASEPDAPSGRQTTTVMWNPATVKGSRLEWPKRIDKNLRLHSRDVAPSTYEAVEGKIFDRYPGLFRFSVAGNDDQRTFDFNLIPLHLKAKAEGAKRRRLASEALAWAIGEYAKDHDEHDWIIGGDFNAEFSTGQFDGLTSDGFQALGAEDEGEGAISYLAGPRSLIDNIFLSPSLSKRFGAEDFFVYAADATKPDFVKTVSDHRPVMVRLSLMGMVDDQRIPADTKPAETSTRADGRDDDMDRLVDELRTLVDRMGRVV